ncbi:MAG: isoprenylcysteine carboxylmethyltransferase family protein [Pseudomonadota bacterium]
MVTLAQAILVFVTLQRLFELWLAQRNTRRLMARGAVEHAPGHYPAIVLLHAAWLIGLWYAALTMPLEVSTLGLLAFVILQGLRVWVLATLGTRWTTRIITLPGEPRITGGPFRFLSHPNYAVVIGEIAVLPATFGLYMFALVFSLANAAVLTIRIRAENAALDHAETASP